MLSGPENLILGAGMTGLACSMATGWLVCEAEQAPGGICSSYYLTADGKRLSQAPDGGEAYRFEIGGGHWIFGGDPEVIEFIRSLVPVESYARKAGIYFRSKGLTVPYPLQNHLAYLGKDIADQALEEILAGHRGPAATMAGWLDQSFGRTLNQLFFLPFHERYTAGLLEHIAPQDNYKSPLDPKLVRQGAESPTPPVGYNARFLYPRDGLGAMAQKMGEKSRIHYGEKAVGVDPKGKEVLFSDGSGVRYERLVSTLPLNRLMDIAGLNVDEDPDPFTSVLVLNIGAKPGPNCPKEHWLYIPDSRSGFYRVGFYSNVDPSFIPAPFRAGGERVSIYVEIAYQGGKKPSQEKEQAYSQSVVQELTDWGFIGDVDVVDATWIDVAYTWSRPVSGWRKRAIRRMEEMGISSIGRYGNWIFQGIADSIREGLRKGAAFKM
jgi:protoporphyrinogen oxidase